MNNTINSERPGRELGFRATRRLLAELLDRDTGGEPGGSSLEAQRITTTEPPRLARADVIEGATIVRRLVPGDADVGFSAFLDGVQASRVLLYESAVPIVYGSVGAVVRVRADRRLATWRHQTESRLYAPLGYLAAATSDRLKSFEIEVVDTTPRRSDGTIDDDARHPLTVADVAVHAAQGHREAVERQLAESWIETGARDVLYIDGGISGSAKVATSSRAVGVVKSHRTLYGSPAEVATVLGLAERERSSVFVITPPNRWRSPVASWYLRLRAPQGRDPLWGLVRVEAAPLASGDAGVIGRHADELSRWVLAEVSPLSLPDGRWDTMAYGIRDCEQFLRSIQ